MRILRKHCRSLWSRLLLAGVVAVFGLVSLAAPILRCECGVGFLTGSLCEKVAAQPVAHGCCADESAASEPAKSGDCACTHDIQAAPKAKLPEMQMAAATAGAQIIQNLDWARAGHRVFVTRAGHDRFMSLERGSPPTSGSIYLIHQNIRC